MRPVANCRLLPLLLAAHSPAIVSIQPRLNITPPELLKASETPLIGDLSVPLQFYQILRAPSPLAGAMLPRESFPWPELSQIGFSSVVCLCSETPRYNAMPLQLVFARELEDLAGGAPPCDPYKEAQIIEDAVNVTLEEILEGRGVLIHCAGERGRTGCVIGGVLCRLGCNLRKVIAYLDCLHRQRGRPGWPEHEWQSKALAKFVPLPA